MLPRVLEGSRRWLFARLVAYGFGQALAAIGTALLVERGFDRLIGERTATLGEFGTVGGGLAFAAACAGWLRMRERVDAERLGQSYVHGVRNRLFKRLTQFAPRSMQQRSQGGIMLRFIGDLNALRQWVSLGLARITVAGTSIVGALVALAFISLRLALATGSVITIGAVVAGFRGRVIRQASREARRRRSRLAANVNEKVATISVMQAFGQSKRERERVKRQSRQLRRAMVERARVVGQLRGIVEVTTALALGAALLAGAVEVGAGRASPGTVVAAMSIVGLLVPPLRDLGRVQEYWHNSRVSLEKIHEFLERGEPVVEAPDAPDLVPGPGHLRIENLEVEGSLRGLSATTEPGTIVGIVGANGAGKTTLLSVIARLVEPTGGGVLVDDQAIADCNLASIRRTIGLVGPDFPLLRGSVLKNLCYRWPEAPDEEVQRVLALCDLYDVLDTLPEGIQSRVGEGGKGLSAGQRQRILLGRALLGNPDILLLDEADSNLDPKASAIVDRIIAEHDGTVLLVTHNPERLKAVDVVWRIDEGRLAAVEANESRSQVDK
ncbi:MAG: ABC transporter ATP-binding protein/permease [Actinomycetota bacterium]|nr:ABC transporter ATP-binding protein/permease [Actinomycetota bacterium]